MAWDKSVISGRFDVVTHKMNSPGATPPRAAPSSKVNPFGIGQTKHASVRTYSAQILARVLYLPFFSPGSELTSEGSRVRVSATVHGSGDSVAFLQVRHPGADLGNNTSKIASENCSRGGDIVAVLPV